MGIGKMRNDYTFYEGYEGEPQIILTLKDKDDMNIHIWDGYFEDIFGTPSLDGSGWTGFTRDYNQLEGAFSENVDCAEISPAEYLADLSSYEGKTFRYEETRAVAALISEFLRYALKGNDTVVVSRE